MDRINVILLLPLLGVVVVFYTIVQVPSRACDFECGTEDSLTSWSHSIDTITGVALYCAWESSESHLLPSWWENIWDSTEEQSNVTRYFIDNTHYKHVVCCSAYAATETTAFTSQWEPDGSWAQNGNHSKFCREIYAKADSVIDFSKFVWENSFIVSHVWLIFVNYEGPYWPSHSSIGGMINGMYWTNDSVQIGGQYETVRLNAAHGAEIRPCDPTRNTYMSESIHEYCHHFGWRDYYGGRPDSVPPYSQYRLYGIGPFAVMGHCWGFRNERTALISPYHKIEEGWVEPTVITEPLYQQPIAHYLSSDEVYKIPHDGSQYFLITNHFYNDIQKSFWEFYYPSWGLVIWHIDESKYHGGTRGRVDVECAHGLWNWTGPEMTGETNTVNGLDSLDRAHPGSMTYFWMNSSKTDFDDFSNPNTYCFFAHKDSTNQNIQSRIAVRNINGSPNDTIYADLLINVWYDTLSGNTTWGPNKTYAITGDVTVLSGDTLFLLPGTTLKFQADEDNQAGGQDTTRCELIIHGHIEADGHPDSVITFTSSAPNPDKRDWYGIRLTPQSSGNFSNCIIEYGEFGIRANQAHLDVDSCEISDSYQHGIYANGADVSVYRSKIEDSGLDGMRCYKSIFDIRLNEIRESYRNGVYCDSVATESDDSVFVVGNKVTNVSAQGVQRGVGVRSQDRYRISGNTVKRFMLGIQCWNYSSGFVDSNTVDSCEYDGLLCGNSSSPLVRSNTIKHVMYGVRASGNSYPDLGDTAQTGDGNNSIYVTSSYRVWNANTGPGVTWIKAENNWWGNASPDSSWFEGLVDWIPYLQYDPNQSKLIAESQVGLPALFTLYQNYPNPFNPATVVEYDVTKATQVLIEVYNLLGRKVVTLRDAHEEPGHKVIRWDGRGESGSVVATGVYFCSMKAGETRQVRKMVVIK